VPFGEEGVGAIVGQEKSVYIPEDYGVKNSGDLGRSPIGRNGKEVDRNIPWRPSRPAGFILFSVRKKRRNWEKAIGIPAAGPLSGRKETSLTLQVHMRELEKFCRRDCFWGFDVNPVYQGRDGVLGG
jgi:hypothetical protein